MAVNISQSSGWRPIHFYLVMVAGLAISLLVADVGVLLALTGLVVVLPRLGNLFAGSASSRPLILISALAVSTLVLDAVNVGFNLSSAWLRIPILALCVAIIVQYGVRLAQEYRDITIRTKLILTVLSVTFLSLSAVGFINNLVLQREINDQLEITLQSIASEEASGIGDVLVSELNLLTVLSTNNLVQISSLAATINNPYSQADIDELDLLWRAADEADNDSDPFVSSVLSSPVSDELRLFRNAFPEHVELFLTDRSGINIAATNRTSDYYQADEGWWQATFADGKGAVFIGQPEFDASSNTLAVNMALPIWSPNQGQIVGILRTTVDISIFNDLLAEATIGETGGVDLRLADDTMISPVGDTALQDLAPDTVSALASMAGFFGEIDYQGHAALVALEPVSSSAPENAELLESLGWFVIAHQAQSEALEAVQAASQTTLLVVALALLASGALAAVLSQLLTRPINDLTVAAARLRSGDFSVQADVTRNDEIGVLAATFNDMTVQIQDLVTSLEDRVADRTRALAISAQISRQLSTILDRERLVSEVVNQVQTAFDYYHAQIYLWDQDRSHLTMAAGTGNAGKLLKDSDHKVPLGSGLVGRAADTNTVMLAADTQVDPDWVANPLLYQTRAEVALPIAIGDQVLGVLDVQHRESGGLTEADVDVLGSIANQVAVALQNANTYVITQEEADRKTTLNEINRKNQNTQSVEDALRVAVREIGRVAGSQSTRVHLGTPPSNAGMD